MKDAVNACKFFNQIDVGGDGKIYKVELLKRLQAKYKSDSDNNGYNEYEEFVRAVVSKEHFINENVLRFAFRYFDKRFRRNIIFDEIKDVFRQSITDKAKRSMDLWKQIISEVDSNGDGIISFNEF